MLEAFLIKVITYMIGGAFLSVSGALLVFMVCSLISAYLQRKRCK